MQVLPKHAHNQHFFQKQHVGKQRARPVSYMPSEEIERVGIDLTEHVNAQRHLPQAFSAKGNAGLEANATALTTDNVKRAI